MAGTVGSAVASWCKRGLPDRTGDRTLLLLFVTVAVTVTVTGPYWHNGMKWSTELN